MYRGNVLFFDNVEKIRCLRFFELREFCKEKKKKNTDVINFIEIFITRLNRLTYFDKTIFRNKMDELI